MSSPHPQTYLPSSLTAAMGTGSHMLIPTHHSALTGGHQRVLLSQPPTTSYPTLPLPQPLWLHRCDALARPSPPHTEQGFSQMDGLHPSGNPGRDLGWLKQYAAPQLRTALNLPNVCVWHMLSHVQCTCLCVWETQKKQQELDTCYCQASVSHPLPWGLLLPPTSPTSFLSGWSPDTITSP